MKNIGLLIILLMSNYFTFAQKNLAIVYCQNAERSITKGNIEEALNCYNKAVSSSSHHFGSRLGRADVLVELGNLDAALVDLDSAVVNNPKKQVGYTKRGILYNLTHKPDSAIKDFTKSIELAPFNYEAHLNRASSYVALEKFREALIDFQRALEIDPKKQDAYYRRSALFEEHEMYDDAIEDLLTLVEKHPSEGRAYAYLGDLYIAAEQPRSAVSNYINAVENKVVSDTLLISLAEAYYQIDDKEKAVNVYSSAIDGLNYRRKELFIRRGQIRRELGYLEEGISDFSKAIADSQSTNTYNERGLTYFLGQDSANAVKDFDMAIKLDKKNGSAFYNRAQLYFEHADLEPALADASKAIKYDGGPHTYYLKAQVYHLMKDDSGVCKNLKKAADRGHDVALERSFAICKK